MRKRHGYRRYTASFSEHDGTQDTMGQPTLDTEADWDEVITGWPAELIAVAGGETLRGRQVTAVTTHVLYGEYFGVEGVKAIHRCQITGEDAYQGVWFEVASPPIDPDGTRMERRIELRRITS